MIKFLSVLRSEFVTLMRFLGSFIYEERCIICSKTGEILCKTCSKNIDLLTPYAQGVINDVHIFSVSKYEKIIKKLIKAYKFQDKKYLCKPLAGLLFEYFQQTELKNNSYLVVPIPCHDLRIKKYGYHHTKALAQEFCKISGFELNTKILSIVEQRPSQHKLNGALRRKNLKGSFGVNEKLYKGQKILIIDDITTTGSTLKEAINQFKTKGINDLVCLTICK